MSPRHYDVENFWNFRLEDLQFLLKQCLERGQHLKILGLQLRHSIHAIRDETRVDSCCDLAPRMLIINSPHNPTGGAQKKEAAAFVSGQAAWFHGWHWPIAKKIASCAAGVSFTQAELDQIFELLEEFEEMPILFSDETLAYIMFICLIWVYLYILYVWHVDV